MENEKICGNFINILISHFFPNANIDKAPSEATFRGTEFLSYDLGQTGGEPIVSAQDAISLYFRTRQPNGLLFFTGKGIKCHFNQFEATEEWINWFIGFLCAFHVRAEGGNGGKIVKICRKLVVLKNLDKDKIYWGKCEKLKNLLLFYSFIPFILQYTLIFLHFTQWTKKELLVKIPKHPCFHYTTHFLKFTSKFINNLILLSYFKFQLSLSFPNFPQISQLPLNFPTFSKNSQLLLNFPSFPQISQLLNFLSFSQISQLLMNFHYSFQISQLLINLPSFPQDSKIFYHFSILFKILKFFQIHNFTSQISFKFSDFS